MHTRPQTLEELDLAIAKIERDLAYEELEKDRPPDWRIKATFVLRLFEVERRRLAQQTCPTCGGLRRDAKPFPPTEGDARHDR